MLAQKMASNKNQQQRSLRPFRSWMWALFPCDLLEGEQSKANWVFIQGKREREKNFLFFSNFSLISQFKYFLQPLAVTKRLETLICVDALAACYQKAARPPLLFHMRGTAETLYFSLTCRNVAHGETSNNTCGKWHVDLPFFLHGCP